MSPTVHEPEIGIVRIPAGPIAEFFGLLKAALVSASEDGCFGLAKGVAYSALTSFFPLFASTAAVLVQANAESISQQLSEFLFEVVPPGSDQLIQYEFAMRGQRPGWLIILASVFSILAASGAMLSLMEGFQAAYRLPTGRPFLKQRLVAILLVMVAAVPAVGASLLILFGGRAEDWFFSLIGVTRQDPNVVDGIVLLGRVARYVIALGTVVLVTGMLYFVGPNTSIKLRAVWPGAFLATALWLISTIGFAWYVRNIGRYNVLYGSIGAVMALVIWMYLVSVIALYGCEYNAERERMQIRKAY